MHHSLIQHGEWSLKGNHQNFCYSCSNRYLQRIIRQMIFFFFWDCGNWLLPCVLCSGTDKQGIWWFGWLCWGLTSQSTIFQSCRDGAIASWVINQYFRGVKCLAQGHNTAEVGLEPRTSRSGVRHTTTELPRSPWYLVIIKGKFFLFLHKNVCLWVLIRIASARWF